MADRSELVERLAERLEAAQHDSRRSWLRKIGGTKASPEGRLDIDYAKAAQEMVDALAPELGTGQRTTYTTATITQGLELSVAKAQRDRLAEGLREAHKHEPGAHDVVLSRVYCGRCSEPWPCYDARKIKERIEALLQEVEGQ